MSIVASRHGSSRWPRGPQLSLPDRAWLVPVLAGLSFITGLAAGLNPVAVIGAAAGAVLVAVVLSDLTAGLMCFGLIAFFDVLPGVGGSVSFAKAAGTLVAISWLGPIVFRPSVRGDFFARSPIASYAAVSVI